MDCAKVVGSIPGNTQTLIKFYVLNALFLNAGQCTVYVICCQNTDPQGTFLGIFHPIIASVSL